MIPILYDSITVGTVPTNYGRGALSDCLGYEVTEKKNGSYELVVTYPATGIHAEELTVGAIIKAKANYTDDPQLFFIYRVGKTINGSFTCNARHISYYLSGKVITSGTAANVAAACALLQSQATGWTISTNKSTAASFKITEPSSVRSWFGGKAGSLIDVYGGEWHFDNFTCRLLATRGADRGVTIRYGKNLTELSQSINMENLATSVQGYYKDTQTGAVTLGTKMPTGLQLSYPRDVVVDFSGEIDTQSATPIATQINALTTKYISGHVLDRAINSITLNIVQEGTGADRVELGDTVKIYFEALGITATTRCVAVTWDGLRDRYKAATFGDVRADITDTIATAQREAAQAVTTDAMVNAVNRATSLITGNSGGYVVLHDSDNDGEPDEILIMNTPDIATATKVWRWNKSGLGYSSTGYAGTYGLAMTADGEIVANYIATGTLDASKITVSNLSASSINTGTLDGTKATITNINASNINTGTLNANLIKAGTISDVAGNSSINMANGVASMYNFDAKNRFRLLSSGGVTKAQITHNTGTGTNLTLFNENGDDCGGLSSTSSGLRLVVFRSNGSFALDAGNNSNNNHSYLSVCDTQSRINVHLTEDGSGGVIGVNSNLAKRRITLQTITQVGSNSGILRIYNGDDVEVATLWVNSNKGGHLTLKSHGGTQTIYGNGETGAFVCVSLTQTSSRKVKENIKPIEDAEKILELEAVSFDYKEKARGTNKRGFIAEDVAKILPNLVTPETDEMPACLDYIEMIPYLQAVIKMQDSKIKALEQRLEVLENKLKEV